MPGLLGLGLQALGTPNGDRVGPAGRLFLEHCRRPLAGPAFVPTPQKPTSPPPCSQPPRPTSPQPLLSLLSPALHCTRALPCPTGAEQGT